MAISAFRHGFKAEAERIALELRGELRVGPQERLDPDALAEHLLIPIRTLRDLASVAGESVRHLLGPGKKAFSAVTVHVSRYKRLIITNPAHASTRHMNSVCHELSHVVLDHEAETPIMSSGRAWDGKQEREADWLAGCLLIPGAAAFAAARRGDTDQDVAEAFGVSVALAAWRMNATGGRLRAQRLAR